MGQRNKTNPACTNSYIGEKSQVAVILNGWLNSEDAPDLSRVAKDIGLNRPNVISMYRNGMAKLPMYHIVPIARSLGRNPQSLMLAALQEYHPYILEALSQIESIGVNQQEAKLLKNLRKAKRQTEKKKEVTGASWKTDNTSMADLINFAKTALITEDQIV